MSKKSSLIPTHVIPPLRLQTLKSYASEIFAPIRRGESVTTIWTPMTGRRIRNMFLINYPDIFAEELGDCVDDLLIYIEPLELTEDSPSAYIKLIIKSVCDSFYKKTGRVFDVNIDASDEYSQLLETLRTIIDKISQEGIKTVLFLGEFDELKFANSVLYNNLKSLWVKLEGNLQFIFLMLKDVTKPSVTDEFGELNSLLLKNIVYIPLSDKEEVNYLIDYFSGQLGREFSQEEREMLYRICGGHAYLIKSCTRLVALMNGKKPQLVELEEKLTQHFELRSVCQKIFNLLDAREQEILRSSISNSTTHLSQDAKMLISLGLVYKNKDGFWKPFGKIFESTIANDQIKSPVFAQSNGHLVLDELTGAILWGSENVEERFTRQEYEILKFFLKNSSKLHSREEIGEAIWGSQSYDKYSDWAIDQVMSKMRKKLTLLGAQRALVTVRGRGYKLVLA